ncbi:MAG: transposase [Terracidiphilus sp.]
MKSITEILGGAQILLGLDYDLQDSFEEYLSTDHRAFLAMLRVVEEHLPPLERPRSGMGRPAYENLPFFRAFLGMSFFRIMTAGALRNRLLTDPNLRQICDFSEVPSSATFSRRFAEFAAVPLATRALNGMVTQYHEGRIVGHISRDSTAIPAREKPVNKKRDVAIPTGPKRKRGRPRKGEVRPPKQPGRLERQLRMKPGKALKELGTDCAWGCKKNSQGNVSFWKGYKLHLDVTDLGIPVTAVVTGANVHDSQVAIPMEKLTERKITFLYSAMDSAYDAAPVATYITGKGRVPLIDPNRRRGSERIPFAPAQKERFKVRTTVERANAHLKDWLVPAKIFVCGVKKVSFQLLCGVLCLAALKIIQYFILPAQ